MSEPSTGDGDAERPSTGALVSWLMLGYMTSQMIDATLRLALPDHLGDRVRTAADLASRTGTHAPSLTRLLRALAGVGIVREVEPDHFALTSAGHRLRGDVDNSLHALARVFSDESMSRAWRDLPETLRTGEPAFDRVFGTDYYSHLARDPELSRLFHEAHSQGTQRAADTVAREYDFSGFDTIVDVGGGDGTLLAAILAAGPGPRGIVYDTETGIEVTPGTLRAAGVAHRCEIRAGDFLADVPEGADLYLLKSVIHNWDDAHVATILGNCRSAMPAHGRLLLIESVLPDQVDPQAPPFAYFSDLNMLVNLGGREHTGEEFRALLADCGFEMTSLARLHRSGDLGLGLIEAVPV